MTEAIQFRIKIPDRELDDLRDGLANTRWPQREPVDDWFQGKPTVPACLTEGR